MTNTQKILKALRSGPKTQADLIRETKVKNVYQIVSDLRKKKIAFMDTANCVAPFNLFVRRNKECSGSE